MRLPGLTWLAQIPVVTEGELRWSGSEHELVTSLPQDRPVSRHPLTLQLGVIVLCFCWLSSTSFMQLKCPGEKKVKIQSSGCFCFCFSTLRIKTSSLSCFLLSRRTWSLIRFFLSLLSSLQRWSSILSLYLQIRETRRLLFWIRDLSWPHYKRLPGITAPRDHLPQGIRNVYLHLW